MRRKNGRKTDKLEKNINAQRVTILIIYSQSLGLNVKTELQYFCIWICPRACYVRLFKHLGNLQEFYIWVPLPRIGFVGFLNCGDGYLWVSLFFFFALL